MDINPASFRDPSGFIFTHKGEIYRAISPSYFGNYDLLIKSGLLDTLQKKKLLLNHIEVTLDLPTEFSNYKIIKPETVPFISYPYEWCFNQLKSAALLTLKIQEISLNQDITLKDASAFNIQFIGSDPIFIDTLSFEKYTEGTPWVAYKQFCQHFLAPLALMAYKSVELIKLQTNYIDGIPLELASALLPSKSIFNSGIVSHLILHSKFQKNSSKQSKVKKEIAHLSKKSLLLMIQHLEDTVLSLTLKWTNSNWFGYAQSNSYSSVAMKAKEKNIAIWLDEIKPNMVWDFGCNTGDFSILASKFSNYVLAIDSDHNCIEAIHYKSKNNNKILPLVINVSSPSPNIGWANKERYCIQDRGKADVLLALALVHHLRIANNIPIIKIAEYFNSICHKLIIEFIPKSDIMVKQMLAFREDVFSDYTISTFIKMFETHFNIIHTTELEDNGRVLFLMTKKN